MDMPDKQSGSQSRPRTAVKDLVLTAMFSALIAVCSILSIPVGEVPITLQTFAVCFAAAMLGKTALHIRCDAGIQGTIPAAQDV